MWNIRQCKYIHHLCGHTGAVFSVDIDDGIRMAYTGSGDKVRGRGRERGGEGNIMCYLQTVRAWRMSDGTCLHEVQASQKYSVISLHYSKVCSHNIMTLLLYIVTSLGPASHSPGPSSGGVVST